MQTLEKLSITLEKLDFYLDTSLRFVKYIKIRQRNTTTY